MISGTTASTRKFKCVLGAALIDSSILGSLQPGRQSKTSQRRTVEAVPPNNGAQRPIKLERKVVACPAFRSSTFCELVATKWI
jgi:hypothetical protein